MTQKEAADSIGKKFKIDDPAFARWTDTIISVSDNGIVHGAILEAYCDNCRFVNPQPAHLKKQTHEQH